ncbi:hypothetical protein AXF42_Ash021271 [Apostasia shenzhenica]|uniref:Tf2-1-like SH3-like domain-containing protein n=1 Tax=Apostasia shenzhenica TaxID=1088818 RepID=A0A2H9ZTP1_9ASPA|nr:hypothetical protein AXF42_Ash021271 [Apostasia shenzhenica]
MSPFKVVHGYKPRTPTDLIPLPLHHRVSESAQSFAEHIRHLHQEISKRISLSNEAYKKLADAHKRLQEFSEGDYVMIRVRLERFPSGVVKKLQARGAGPFKILKKLGSNAYVVDLPSDFGISTTFNISDLVAYKEPAAIPSDPFEPSSPIEREPTPECPLSQPSTKKEQIEQILDDQIISTRNRGY